LSGALVGMTRMDGAPDTGTGFFGKVTSHGDFVGRRLPPSFREPWDGWLQGGLQASREALGPRWLAIYLSSPFWRFALAPGVCGAQGWAGVLMPSVDRVGRYFPLTLAAGTDAPPLDCVMQHDTWYGRLEELALLSLRQPFSLDEFDAALAALEAPGGQGRPPPGGAVIALDPGEPLPGQLANAPAALLHRVAAAALDGHSLWWTSGAPQVAPCLLVCRGLPAAAAFPALLDGEWQAHGWPGAEPEPIGIRTPL
jgi:type VI secretion system protein ImpM